MKRVCERVAKARFLTGLLLVASIVASVALSEVGMRWVVERPLPRLFPQVRYDPHPVRRFTLRPQQEAYTYGERVRIDRTGFRSNGGSNHLQPRVRIFALGDSFTFGIGVSDPQTWPAHLEKLLNAQIGGVQVINGGTVSYGVFQELDLLREQGLSIRPHVVIHGLYWNDYMSNHPPRPNDPAVLTAEGYFVWDDNSSPENPFLRAKRWLLDNSALVFAIANAVRRLREDHAPGVVGYEAAYHRLVEGTIPPDVWEPVEDFYQELRILGEKHGFVPYIVIFPVAGIIGVPDPANHPYPRNIRGMLNRLGLPYLDGFALWEALGLGREMFLPHNRHLNSSGYGVIAAALARALTEDEKLVGLFTR